MQSKLSRYSEGLMEAIWLAALVIIPIFFNVYSSRIFEPDKIAILRSLALLGLGAWAVKIIDQGRIDWGRLKANNESFFRGLLRVPILPAVIALAAIYLIGTILSISPRVSIFGSYQRLQGTYTTFSYLILFAMTAANLRRKDQIDRIISVIIISSLSISLYGVLQKYGLDPIPWGGDTSRRIAANLGNAIFIAAYLVMAFPLTLGRIVDSFSKILDEDVQRLTPQVVRGVVYVFTAALQLIAIYFSLSRGPILGLLAGTFFMVVLLSLYWGKRWLTFTSVGAAAVLGVFLVTLSIPGGPLDSLRSNDNIGRLGNVFETQGGTGRVRTLIWEGAARLSWFHDPIEFPDGSKDPFNVLRPVFGYGPETMYVAYNPFYPPELGSIESRNATPDRSHNETWDSVVITGWVGLVVEQLVFMSIFFFGMKWLGLIQTNRQSRLFFLLTLGGGLISTIVFIYFSGLAFLGVGLPFGILLGLLAYLAIIALFSRYEMPKDDGEKYRSLFLMMFVGAIIAHYVEIHFGIAIAATRTYFWVYAGAMLAIGHWMTLDKTFGLNAYQKSTGIDLETNIPVETPVNKKTKSKKKVRGKKPGWSEKSTFAWTNGLLSGLILSTLVFNFISNSQGDANFGSIIIQSLTTTPNQAQASYGIFGIFFICWIAAAALASAEWSRENIEGSGYVFFTTAGISLAVWLFYALMHSTGLINIIRAASAQTAGGTALDRILLQTIAIENLLSRFYVIILILILLIAWQISNTQKSTSRRSALRLTSVFALSTVAVAILFLVSSTNLKVIQADMAFKVADPFARGEETDNWRLAIDIYQRAIDLAPQQDHYFLFLGRAYLELTRLIQATSPPEAVNLMIQAESDLKKAQEINPLNTDHTANIARLHRFWSNLQGSDPQYHLTTAKDNYERALVLSPNNSGIWNEFATLHLQDLQESDKGLAILEESLARDPFNDATYGLLGDYYANLVRTSTEAEKASAAQKSVAYYENAIEVSRRANERFRYYVGIANLYTDLEDIDKAISAYKGALDNADQSQVWVIEDTIAKVLAQNNSYEEALIYAQRSFINAPESQKETQQQLLNYIQGLISTQE